MRIFTDFLKKSFLSLTLLSWSGISAHAAGTNFIPIEVGPVGTSQVNAPIVTLTICAPGTKICQSIPNIELDTGSTGLRILTRAMNAELLNALPSRKDPSGNDIAECYEYAGNDNWWGRVGIADVQMGSDTAAAISVELVDANYKAVPKDCLGDPKMVAGEGINGVLGVTFVRTDCYDQDCVGGAQTDGHNGMAYYSCDDQNNCTAYTMAKDLQVINPVFALNADSNGYVIEMSAVTSNGASSGTGKMILGIGTEDDNQLDPSVSKVALADDDSFPIVVNGNAFHGYVDSGTVTYALPAKELNVPLCGTDWYDYLCPTAPTEFNLSFTGANAALPPLQVSIASAKTLLDGDNLAEPELACDATEGYPDYFFLGMSYFFGRKIYFGFDVANAPMGAGDHLGFSTAAAPL